MDCLFAKCTQLPIYFFIRSLTQNNRHTVHYGLRDGRIGKIRETIQSCLTVSKKIANVFFSLTRKFRVAKDSRFKRLKCTHKGTYADDCIVSRVMMHKCYIVATCDKDLKRRIRKIPGVPIMYISQRKYTVERMPESLVSPFPSFLGFSSFYYLLYDEKTETWTDIHTWNADRYRQLSEADFFSYSFTLLLNMSSYWRSFSSIQINTV